MKSGFTLNGAYTMQKYKALPAWLPRAFRFWIHKQGLTKKISETYHKNVIVFNFNHGMHLVLQNLGGDSTFPMALTFASIGQGSNVPTLNDVGLQIPIFTNISISTSTVNDTSLDTEWFITNDELVDGTYTEFGIFCGTQLFARSLIQPNHVKVDGEDTLVAYTITAAVV